MMCMYVTGVDAVVIVPQDRQTATQETHTVSGAKKMNKQEEMTRGRLENIPVHLVGSDHTHDRIDWLDG